MKVLCRRNERKNNECAAVGREKSDDESKECGSVGRLDVFDVREKVTKQQRLHFGGKSEERREHTLAPTPPIAGGGAASSCVAFV
jgi:hypothetical protein